MYMNVTFQCYESGQPKIYIGKLMAGRTFVVDVDGTLCGSPPNRDYSKCKPIQSVIDKVNQCYYEGDIIILFTARGMRTYDGDLAEIEKHVKPVLIEWLNTYNVKYDRLIMGKPWGPEVYYVDDRGVSPKGFVEDF